MPELVQGIVLDSFKFKENSVVCKIFTKQHGIISVLMNGVGKKSSHVNQVHLQPLTQIEFVVYLKEKRGILRVKDISLIKTPLGILPDIKCYSIASFVAEIVLRTFREHETDPRLYDLLCHVLTHIEAQEASISDIHLFFLCSYSNILGFDIKSEERFDMDNRFDELDEKSNSILLLLLDMKQYSPMGITKYERRNLLRFILRYLSQHIEMPRIKSLEILEEVLS